MDTCIVLEDSRKSFHKLSQTCRARQGVAMWGGTDDRERKREKEIWSFGRCARSSSAEGCFCGCGLTQPSLQTSLLSFSLILPSLNVSTNILYCSTFLLLLICRLSPSSVLLLSCVFLSLLYSPHPCLFEVLLYLVYIWNEYAFTTCLLHLLLLPYSHPRSTRGRTHPFAISPVA